MSIVEERGCDSHTQFGRGWGGRGLSTVRWTSGFSGEQWRGIASIPARGRRRLDQGGLDGGRERRGSSWALGFGREGAAAEYSGERSVVVLVVARKKKGKTAGRIGLGSGFTGEHCFVEERERESRRAAGSGRRAAPMPSGMRGGRSAPAARRGRARGSQQRQRGRWEEQPGDT
jgi:hypothetical protein